MSQLKEDLKVQIIKHLNLVEVEPSMINDPDPLFGEGLGLDSIDALELIVLLDEQYGLKVANPEDGKQVFHSIDSLAKYIEENRN